MDYTYRTDKMLETLKSVIEMKNAFRALNKADVLEGLTKEQKIKLEERINEIELSVEHVGRLCKRVFEHL
jgi:hypothetical protein